MDTATADALPLLTRALSYESSLRRRTEGVTWAIWGVVLATIMRIHAQIGTSATPPMVGDCSVVPWILLGAGVT